MTSVSYPVHVDATLDRPLSRWLWLVKWVLAIPHCIVLAVLWVGFVLFSVVAFFAILFTGRYPRRIFDFNVGVLRWTWRVQYYTYGALATDRYPPFTLDDVPDYPAHLDVTYPGELSRGLVLVKWWLLAIPHYLIIGLFLGGAWFGAHLAGGLISLLALVAAVFLAFTGKYPESIYDFVLGMNRWVLRVAAYAGLMTDEYPPFRLDMGGHEPPGTMLLAPAPSAPETQMPETQLPAPSTTPRRSGSTGRVIGLVLGCLAVLVSFGLLAGGSALLWVDHHRDAGYVTSDVQRLDSAGYAVTSERLNVGAAVLDWGWQSSVLGDVRIRATGVGSTPLFIGIAPTADITRYLGDVSRTIRHDFGPHSWTADAGSAAPSGPPAAQQIWVAKAAGPGQQALVWRVGPGDWTIVVMNADTSRGVHASADIGATAPDLGWFAAGLFIAGGLGLLIGATVVVLTVRRRSHA